MIHAEILNPAGDLVYNINIYGEYYLVILLGAIASIAFFMMMKR